MQHFNIIDENQTIYESLDIINKNFRSLLDCHSGATAPVGDSNTPIPAGMLWYNSAENRVYQKDYNNPANWILVSDLNGTATTKEYVDGRITGHNHDLTYLKIDAPAKDVQFVNGTASDQVIFKSNISDTEGTNSATIAPSSRLFEQTRQQVRAFIDTLGDPDTILKQLQDILKLIEDNQGNLDNLGIDNIQGLRSALDGKMPLATTLEDLGGVRADGASPNGFTGRVLFKSTSAIANGGALVVGRDGTASTLQAVRIWDDGGTNPDAVQIGDNTARTFINAISPNDAYVAVGGTTRHVIYNNGNIADLDTDLGTRGFMKEADADAKYLLATGKAADSALLNGVAENTAQSNNTIVKRNGAGDIITRYFRTNAGAGASSDANYFLVQRATGTGGDNYARPVSKANIKNSLGISNLPNWSQSDFDNRYLNADGDTSTGNLTVNANFRARDFEVRQLPSFDMGSGGINDEYLIIAKKRVSGNVNASGIAGDIIFQRGSSTSGNDVSITSVLLLAAYNTNLFDQFDVLGSQVFTSIDTLNVGGTQYYALKARTSGGGGLLTMEFRGSVYNVDNDALLLTKVRVSDSNVTFVESNWVPATAVNSFNLFALTDPRHVKSEGDTMTGTLTLDNGVHVKMGSGSGLLGYTGKHVLHDHGNGHVTISATSTAGNLYLGFNSGSAYVTNKVRLESDLLTNGGTVTTIRASDGALYDVGQRVYSPSNKSTIAFKDQSNVFTASTNKFNAQLFVGAKGIELGNTGVDSLVVGDGMYINSDSTSWFGAAHNGAWTSRWGVSSSGVWDLQGEGSVNPEIRVDGNKVWHAGNDGSGSGLDADLLDGASRTSSDFLGGSLISHDTRNNNYAPGDRTRGAYFDFRGNTAGGLSDGGSYHGVMTFRPYGSGPDWSGGGAHQIAFTSNGNMYHRYGGTGWGGYRKIWNSGNDGSGSGLDADLLDGVQGASFARSDANDTITGQWNINGEIHFNVPLDVRFNSGASSDTLITMSNTMTDGKVFYINNVGGDNILSFTRNGANNYTSRFFGELTSNGNKVWHAGNDGSGSGLDADLLDGLQASSFLRSGDSTKQTVSGNIFNFWQSTTNRKINVDARWGQDSTGTDSGNLHIWATKADGSNYGVSGIALHTGSKYSYMRAIDNSWLEFRTNGGANGYIRLGPANTSHAHIYTDRPNFYFNKELLVNNNKVWHAGNDGSGSGLDADRVDGIQGSQFLRSDTNDTATGVLTLSGQVKATASNNEFNGHHYYNAYDNAGNHYPHYRSGNSGNGAIINMRVYSTASAYKVLKIAGKTGEFSWNGNKIWHAGNDGSGSGLDADKLDGLHRVSGGSWSEIVNRIPSITSNGVMEIARYIDFHTTNSTTDYDVRLDCNSANVLNVTGGNLTIEGQSVITRPNASRSFSGSHSTGSTALRWYRIGKATGGTPASGIFTVRGTKSGHHTVVTFLAACSYGQRPQITVLNNSQYGSYGIHQVRLEYLSTYDEFHVQVQADCDSLVWEATNCIGFSESWVANDSADRSGVNMGITGDYSFMTSRMSYQNGIRLGANTSLYLDGGSTYYMRESNGSYGTVSVHGKKGGWEGYSIADRVCFMHDGGNAYGIYNDVDNEWSVLAYRNGETRLYYNGLQRITANSAGAAIAGSLTASSNVTAYSDRRLKTDLKVIDNPLDRVSKISGYTFERVDIKCPRQTGVIAQEVKEVLPEVVVEDEEGNMSVAYGNMVGLLIECVKELKAEVEALKNDTIH